MATYTNAGNADNIDDDLSNPSYGGTDVINVVKGDVNYDSDLTALTTTVAEFNTGPGYAGNLGSYPQGLQVPADEIRLNDRGRQHALRDKTSHTVDLMVLEPLANPKVTLHDFDTITLLQVKNPCTLTAQDSAIVTTCRITGPGINMIAESAGTAFTLLHVSAGKGSGSSVISSRTCTALEIESGCTGTIRDSAAVTTLTVRGTFKHESDGAITTINVYQGAVIDLSAAAGNSASITWNVYGDFTIIRPPNGITIDEPTTGELGDFEVTFR